MDGADLAVDDQDLRVLEDGLLETVSAFIQKPFTVEMKSSGNELTVHWTIIDRLLLTPAE